MLGIMLAPASALAGGLSFEIPIELDAMYSAESDKPGFAFGGHMKSTPLLAQESSWSNGFAFVAGAGLPSPVGHFTVVGGPGMHLVLEGTELEVSAGFELALIYNGSVSIHNDFEMMFEAGGLHEIYFRTILDFTSDGHGLINPIFEMSGTREEGEVESEVEEEFLARLGVGVRPWKIHPIQFLLTMGGGQGDQGFFTIALGVRFDIHGVHADHDDHGDEKWEWDEDYEEPEHD